MATSEIDQLKDALREQTALLERLGSSAMEMGTIVAREDAKHLVAQTNSGRVLLVKDQGAAIGSRVYLLGETGQIFGVSHFAPVGDIVTVHAVLDSGHLVISAHGSERAISPGNIKKLAKGDRVLLDGSGTIVLELVERAPKPPYVPRVAPVRWDDIGGHKGTKQILIDAVETPYKHPAIFKHYGKKAPKGVALFGPPGCGKTMFGKAIATSVNGGDQADGFLAIKGPEILDPYVGVAEAAVRDIFARARLYRAESGKPAVIFIDEAEAILGRRGNQMAGGMEKTIVPTFLTEMDGLEESSAIVVLCTNRGDLLDEAVVRDGRIDHKIEIGRPNRDEAREILGIHLKPVPMAKGLTHASSAEQTAELIYKTSPPSFPYSGAMMAGIVEKAKEAAIRRDIAGGQCTGVNADDLAMAVLQTQRQEAGRPQ